MKKGYLVNVIFFVIFFISVFAAVYYIFFAPAEVKINKRAFPIQGIDISAHTGKVDFVKLKKYHKTSVQFVYIKATEGKSLVDKSFDINYKNARINKIPVGAYHFFRFNKSGSEQALNFLQTIRGKHFDLPLVLDIEEWKNVLNSKKLDIGKEIRCFVDIVEKTKKQRLMFYSNESSFSKYIEEHFQGHHVWICSFNDKPGISSKWTFWQYAHDGKMKGADGWIDLNAFHGTIEEWETFLSKY